MRCSRRCGTGHTTTRSAVKSAGGGAKCTRGYAPQGPLGEVYATHATITVRPSSPDGQAVLTWRYVIAAQVARRLLVSPRALGIMDAQAGGRHVCLRFDELTTFRPASAAQLAPLGKGLVIEATEEAQCATAPSLNVSTPCYPFDLHTVAPVAANGWVRLCVPASG